MIANSRLIVGAERRSHSFGTMSGVELTKVQYLLSVQRFCESLAPEGIV